MIDKRMALIILISLTSWLLIGCGPRSVQEFNCESLLDKIYAEDISYFFVDESRSINLPMAGLSDPVEIARTNTRLRCKASTVTRTYDEEYFYQVQENTSNSLEYTWGRKNSYGGTDGLDYRDCHTLVSDIIALNHENEEVDVKISRIFDVEEVDRTAITYECRGTAKLTEPFLGSNYLTIEYYLEMDPRIVPHTHGYEFKPR